MPPTRLLLFLNLLICHAHLLQPLPHRLRIRTYHTAVPPHLRLLMLNVCLRALAGDSVLVAEDEDVLIFPEEAINVFEFSTGGLRVKD